MAERIPDVSRAVPRRGEVAWHEEHGRVVVVRQRFGPVRRRVLRLFGVPPELRVTLDAIGSAVWLLLDGKRTAADILHELQATMPGEADLNLRLGKFLGAMVSRRLVELG